MAMAANKVDGVRAAPAQSDDEVKFTREHNDANVLTLGAKYLDEDRALDLIHIFLNTEFAGGRHARRVAKIASWKNKGRRVRPAPEENRYDRIRNAWPAPSPKSIPRSTRRSSTRPRARTGSSN